MIIQVPEHSHFTIDNIPFGIFSTIGTKPRVGVAIGGQILDLAALADLGAFHFDASVFHQSVLNDFIALGKKVTTKVRTDIQEWLKDANSILSGQSGLFVSQAEANMHMPIRVGDYTDFYSSIEHATNVGKMFRGPENALLPNWRHIPVGYHGRASSIVVSGEPIYRPQGQVMLKEATTPVYQPTTRLDFELEMAFIIGKQTNLGEQISTGEATDYIFGMVLFNDWSARDIQKWEYVPLGPFLGKNFASSISPWVVTLEALEPFKVNGPVQEPPVQAYLSYEGAMNYDIGLEVAIQPQNGEATLVSQSNFKYMYWNMAQQLAHHTVNGCNVRVGDMLASGTISGKDDSSFGSMLEIAWAGTKPVTLKDGTQRVFIQDFDQVIMTGYAANGEKKLGFGTVETMVLPAKG